MARSHSAMLAEADNLYQRGDLGVDGRILVRRPTRSPAIVRDIPFSTVEEAEAYILSLPPGAAYDARALFGSPNSALEGHLLSRGIGACSPMVTCISPWDYWATEEQCAG